MTRLHDIPCSMGDDAAQLFGASGVIGFQHLPVDFPAVRIANPFAAAGLFSWFHRKATGLRYVGISLGCATKLRHNLFRWAFERSNSMKLNGTRIETRNGDLIAEYATAEFAAAALNGWLTK